MYFNKKADSTLRCSRAVPHTSTNRAPKSIIFNCSNSCVIFLACQWTEGFANVKLPFKFWNNYGPWSMSLSAQRLEVSILNQCESYIRIILNCLNWSCIRNQLFCSDGLHIEAFWNQLKCSQDRIYYFALNGWSGCELWIILILHTHLGRGKAQKRLCNDTDYH